MAHAAAAVAPDIAAAPDDTDQLVVLHDVEWKTYRALRELFDRPGIRLTYLAGALEIMSPSKKHEVYKKQIARFVELFALEMDIPLFGYGSSTLREELQVRGIEPDECWAVGRTLAEDDPPDIAVEVVLTSGGINKLDVYRGLGVREVWFWYQGQFQLFGLVDGQYERVHASAFLPGFDLAEVATLVEERDQHRALKAFRDRLRKREP
ncbi:MAG TPA: Uma2 family endonuclease [Kofleriaceae bacterium]|nr:Uma2 family endonuclease [Kofleriaceae bacterium]